MKTLTRKRALDLMRKAVEKKGPDYVYDHDGRSDKHQVCTYSTEEGEPSCLLGHIFYEFDREVFREISHLEWDILRNKEVPESSTFKELPRHIIQKINPGAFVALEAAQESQDSGISWGRALNDAIDSRIHNYSYARMKI